MSKAYGCGPPSYATSEEVSLTWGVKPCPRGMWCHGEPACGGPLPTPNNIDSIDWLSREDLKFILEVGKPYGNPECCSGANCGGTPCCVSAFSDKGDGQEVCQIPEAQGPLVRRRVGLPWRAHPLL